MPDWREPEHARVLRCVERWLADDHPRARHRRCAWYILLAPCLRDSPSQRTDLLPVALAAGDSDDGMLRADLEQLLNCVLLPGLHSSRVWTPTRDREALTALRTLRSHFEDVDWIRVPGEFPERCYFPRHEARDSGLRIFARTVRGEVELRPVDASESGICAEVAAGPHLKKGAILSDIRFERGNKVHARIARGEVLRVDSPAGIILHPDKNPKAYRELLATLPRKLR